MTKIRFLLGLGLFVSSIIMVGCENSQWSKDKKDELLDRCDAEGGSKSYCKCYLENAMVKYPNPADMDDIDFESAVELAIDCE